ncbi:hypothetical protein HHK36_015986 [Tetracentron sinense]|uniref:Uncharacterized protein n=1 Tax=Tetracentron sinense TaxID=13715 RepID=A0A834YWD5_TETSI|nr:hypothetical protein HHK36_015986 [Tetracentron sinense]
MANIDCRDLEESFSFSCYDLNSTLGIFSDSEDDSYFEIGLQPTPDPPESDHQEFDFFPISFSQTRTPLPLQQHLKKNPETDCSSTLDSSSGSGSSSGDESTPVVTPLSTTQLSSPRKLNMILWRLRGSSKISDVRPEDNRQMIVKTGCPELDRSRKTSKIATAINGGIMKFLIKFRSLKIRFKLVKPPHQLVISSQSNRNSDRMSEDTLHNHRRAMKPFDKWKTKSNKALGNYGGKSRVMEINVDAIKGVVEAMSLSIIGRKGKETKSCPSSIKSSPVHRGVPSENRTYARENSVQAAIAHCKRSFGGTSDFCF